MHALCTSYSAAWEAKATISNSTSILPVYKTPGCVTSFQGGDGIHQDTRYFLDIYQHTWHSGSLSVCFPFIAVDCFFLFTTPPPPSELSVGYHCTPLLLFSQPTMAPRPCDVIHSRYHTPHLLWHRCQKVLHLFVRRLCPAFPHPICSGLHHSTTTT
jgi:hypothetical protein